MKNRIFMKTALTAAVSVALANSASAIAQETPEEMEQIEVVKQRQPYRGDVPLKSLPQNIDVVSAELLKDVGVNDFQNALDFASGVARQNSFGGLWDSFAIRGFAGDENLPSGYVVNGFSAGRGFSGRRDTSNVQAIEVLKGPGSALYGRSEPGGTINIITKKPQFTEEGYIQATAGTYSLYRLEGDYTNAINDDLAFRVNGAYEDAGSFRNTVESNKLAFTPSLTYQITDDTSLTYELEVLDQEAPFDRGIVVVDYQFGTVPIDTFYGEPNDGPMSIEALGHQLTLQHGLNSDWSVMVGLSYRESSFEGYSSEVELSGGRQLLYTDGETVSRQRRYRDYDAEDLSGRIELSGTVETGDIVHHILIGADAYDYQLDQIQQRWRTAWGAGDTTYSVSLINPEYGQAQPETGALWDRREDQSTVGLYVQDQIDITDSLKVLAGFRFDDYSRDFYNYLADSESSQSQTATSPRIGLVYEPSNLYTLYLSYSEGFRPNSGTDADGEAFDPEESKSYEAGVKFANSDESLTGTVAIFRAEKSNVLSADPVNSGYSAALGEAESQGIEVDLNAVIADDTTVTVAYAYVDAETSNDIVNFDWGVNIPAGSRLINIPEHKLNVTAMHFMDIAGKESKVGASVTYVGDRLGETIDPDYILPSYTTVRLFGSVNLSDNVVINADIDNLFDKEYYASSYSALWTMPGTPRTAKISVKYAF
ncbi:iron complex outermembrane recepter protein [Marisediminitalea aggregata]|uniref:Iron complex outermembrane recepter protein n=1 Tax=Marisediminitalea aggregata TaxID=634436 RepID=A0A1M5EZB7_9ALTE|nr:TonB-dependent siderophore receptor [Marisediminitalea aggregata]SHF84594.1 iron complex outermembrane recepter protein [Marisediminitalea aggregata]